MVLEGAARGPDTSELYYKKRGRGRYCGTSLWKFPQAECVSKSVDFPSQEANSYRWLANCQIVPDTFRHKS